MIIAGVDEVGRGCLAGPVVAAAVILNNFIDSYLKPGEIVKPFVLYLYIRYVAKEFAELILLPCEPLVP